MKALVQRTYGPPDGLRLADVERPAPGPRDVLILERSAEAVIAIEREHATGKSVVVVG